MAIFVSFSDRMDGYSCNEIPVIRRPSIMFMEDANGESQLMFVFCWQDMSELK
jgi:hypothetical protein